MQDPGPTALGHHFLPLRATLTLFPLPQWKEQQRADVWMCGLLAQQRPWTAPDRLTKLVRPGQLYVCVCVLTECTLPDDSLSGTGESRGLLQ